MTNNDPFHGIEIRDIEVYVPTEETLRVAAEIVDERVRQFVRWGDQTHPDGTGEAWKFAADEAKRINATRSDDGSISWGDILLEEVFEAMAEEDYAALRAELIQVAAVAAAWVEDIDRKAGK